jgi:hydrogenase expression/formation protein HypC
MCLALPARIVEMHDDDEATVELGGVRQRISVALVEEPAVDDWVVIHVGYALTKLSPEEAERTLALVGAEASVNTKAASVKAVSAKGGAA